SEAMPLGRQPLSEQAPGVVTFVRPEAVLKVLTCGNDKAEKQLSNQLYFPVLA
ncbi:hypothetical protein A2U01_0089071, partial [Trifolium medium]|nr:hypothetical protein [Trifolium medium]